MGRCVQVDDGLLDKSFVLSLPGDSFKLLSEARIGNDQGVQGACHGLINVHHVEGAYQEVSDHRTFVVPMRVNKLYGGVAIICILWGSTGQYSK